MHAERLAAMRPAAKILSEGAVRRLPLGGVIALLWLLVGVASADTGAAVPELRPATLGPSFNPSTHTPLLIPLDELLPLHLLRPTRDANGPEDPRHSTPRVWLRMPSIWSFVKLPAVFKPSVTGKSSFLAGFGLGVLVLALKKLLLPLLIGGQIIKSLLVALFLPSLLGGLGKLAGKGAASLAAASAGAGGGLSGGLPGALSGGLSGGLGGGGHVDDFGDLKDPAYGDPDPAASTAFAYDAPHYATDGVSQPASHAISPNTIDGRFGAQSKVGMQEPIDNFYQRRKQPDFQSFHTIPASSLLLTHFDPFYSPLLSRLDSVFAQLGHSTEACRERLVCAMYAAPARFAPFSNLVSAQLSRELNELRKPASDNPEILRFFRYMKAAKDGQDGQDCFALHPGCVKTATNSALATTTTTGSKENANDAGLASPPMLKTYHDINKLVQARHARRMKSPEQERRTLPNGS